VGVRVTCAYAVVSGVARDASGVVPGPRLGGQNSPLGCSGVAGARSYACKLPPGWERPNLRDGRDAVAPCSLNHRWDAIEIDAPYTLSWYSHRLAQRQNSAASQPATAFRLIDIEVECCKSETQVTRPPTLAMSTRVCARKLQVICSCAVLPQLVRPIGE
jgi:hypothetical protein